MYRCVRRKGQARPAQKKGVGRKREKSAVKEPVAEEAVAVKKEEKVEKVAKAAPTGKRVSARKEAPVEEEGEQSHGK